MINPKTTPSAPKPKPQNGWIRKSELDAWLGRFLPVPTQAVSNEEYNPMAQTPAQRRVEHLILSSAEAHAGLDRTDRRSFLRSSSGMALAFAGMNTVYGKCFRVNAAELSDAAAAEGKTRFFIFDIQTHHVATPEQVPHPDEEFLHALYGIRETARQMNPALTSRQTKPEDLYLENYIKEVFLDSETDVVALSALPGSSEEADVLTPDVLFLSRSLLN